MLLRFGVENHRSISRRQELLLVASKLRDRPDALIPLNGAGNQAAVAAVVLYGANASGKTNFIDAVTTMKNMVVWSHIRGVPGGGVPRQVFRLDRSWMERPTCFDVDILIDGVRYHYGFEVTDDEYTSEWLYEFPKSHRRRLFERDNGTYRFGRWLKGRNNSIAKLTRTNSLFLSAAAQNGHEQLSRIYKYFREISVIRSTSMPGSTASRRFLREGSDKRVIEFLRNLDTGVVDYQRAVKVLKRSQNPFLRLKIAVDGNSGGENGIEAEEIREVDVVELAHRGKGGENFYFDLSDESAGTLRLLGMLGRVFRAIDRGTPIFVDELEASLHTRASEAVVGLFCSQMHNSKGAQLIATTHDTNLMRFDLLRRDQLWFAEKTVEGATEIFPLTDIRTRKGDNLELGYQQGRFGAVPMGNPVATFSGPD